MADSFTTLADLVKINDANLADIDVTDLLDDAPLLAALASVPASNGTDHKYLKETTAPTVGFRGVNDGRDNSKSADTLVTINLKILDASFAVDQALAHAYRGGVEAYIQREGIRHLKAAMFQAEKQVVGGTNNESAGFTGFEDSADLDALADTDTVVDAGGTTESTASSVYLIRSLDDGCAVIGGNDGEIMMGETVSQRLAGSTGTYPAYYTPVTGWLGLQLGAKFDIVRICNLTEDSGKGLTDDLISTALSKFAAARRPNIIAMSRRSLKQLQQSRTATNATGAPAPFPADSFGVPIVTTDGITDTETLLT